MTVFLMGSEDIWGMQRIALEGEYSINAYLTDAKSLNNFMYIKSNRGVGKDTWNKRYMQLEFIFESDSNRIQIYGKR